MSSIESGSRLNGKATELYGLGRDESMTLTGDSVDNVYDQMRNMLGGRSPSLAAQVRERYSVVSLGGNEYKVTYHHIEADPADAKVKLV